MRSFVTSSPTGRSSSRRRSRIRRRVGSARTWKVDVGVAIAEFILPDGYMSLTLWTLLRRRTPPAGQRRGWLLEVPLAEDGGEGRAACEPERCRERRRAGRR